MPAEVNPLVTINIVVLNGEKYIRHCLEAVKKQLYSNIEINVLDNGSKDKTKEIVREFFENENCLPVGDLPKGEKLKIKNSQLIESSYNYGMWGGQEKALEYSHGKYIMSLSSDVLLEPEAIGEAVRILETDKKIGAVELKIYQFSLLGNAVIKTNIIDTCGFSIFRSRRVINIGHGQEDKGENEFNTEHEVFAVEGAAPIFRRTAFEDCRVMGDIMDHDMWWYGDDVDLGWRMRLFGWKHVFDPKAIAYHDRKTTNTTASGWHSYIWRIADRRKIPILKRRLDWRNMRLTLIKNDYGKNILRDMLPFVWREFMVFGYTLLVEPKVFAEYPKFFRLLPRMLKKRKEIMKKAVAGPDEIHKWMK